MNRPYFCPENWKALFKPLARKLYPRGNLSRRLSWGKRTIVQLGTLHSVYFSTRPEGLSTRPEGLVKKTGMQSHCETMFWFLSDSGKNRFSGPWPEKYILSRPWEQCNRILYKVSITKVSVTEVPFPGLLSQTLCKLSHPLVLILSGLVPELNYNINIQ